MYTGRSSCYMMVRRTRMETCIWVRLIAYFVLRAWFGEHVVDVPTGHALNKIIKDIINRYQLSMGRNVQYVFSV